MSTNLNTEIKSDAKSDSAIELTSVRRSPIPTAEVSGIECTRLESLNFAAPVDVLVVDGPSTLKRVDGGFGAWSYVRLDLCAHADISSKICQLVSACLVEMIVWGFPTAFGSFLETYLREADIVSQPHATSLLPLIGTLSSGIMYCTGRQLVDILWCCL
jgi:MCP family monocarboxylic acid transporter-like MFS transporter 10